MYLAPALYPVCYPVLFCFLFYQPPIPRKRVSVACLPACLPAFSCLFAFWLLNAAFIYPLCMFKFLSSRFFCQQCQQMFPLGRACQWRCLSQIVKSILFYKPAAQRRIGLEGTLKPTAKSTFIASVTVFSCLAYSVSQIFLLMWNPLKSKIIPW